MARLNEPAMSTDTLEILKRKFLRQNREIAKINSNQSQRIRELENDCARMLSENLELRSEILQLENEAERNASQRIADHALDVKAKLEEQLSIFSTLLEGLGTEPPRKRHAPDGRRLAKAKPSSGLTSPARRLRNVARDMEAEALQEERLPPIPENRSYPRATLNGDEIRAMLSESADNSTDSPDLGPPPVSRFVDTDPVKVDSPSSKSIAAQLEIILPEHTAEIETLTPAPLKLDFNKPVATIRRPKDPETSNVPIKTEAPSEPPASTPISQHPKAGSKRKYGDENERTATTTGKQNAEDCGKENPTLPQNLSKRRPIKDIPPTRRAPLGEKALPPPARKALAAKSTNEDIGSPRKVDKPANNEPVKSGKQPADKPNPRPNAKRSAPIIEIPPAQVTQAPPPVTAILELETPVPETPLTPVHSAPRTIAHDTPPPSAINSNGEAIRPSRRARAAVSYAEPNLRDKMRRPTKELTDAVSGEGKFRQRASIHIKDEPKDENGVMSAAKDVVIKEEPRAESSLSPLAQRKTQELTPESDTSEPLPSGSVTQRKRRGSSMAPRESFGPANTIIHKTDEMIGDDTTPSVDEQSEDPYDFNTLSPGPSEKGKENEAPANDKGENMNARSTSRKSRASASFQGNAGSLALEKGKEVARKRASMAAPRTKASSIVETDDGEESSLEVEPAVMERVPRRRSMML